MREKYYSFVKKKKRPLESQIVVFPVMHSSEKLKPSRAVQSETENEVIRVLRREGVGGRE